MRPTPILAPAAPSRPRASAGSCERALLHIVLSIALASAVFLAPPRAQAQTAQTEELPDDVQWEQRSVPYHGGPVRPGAQLDSSLSLWAWVGIGGLAGGYALSFYGFASREYAIIPVVGPWLAAFGVLGGPADEWSDEQTAWSIVAGVLQPAGIAVLIYGLLNPAQRLVFDAPVGVPSPHETYTISLLPGARGADVGASLSVTWL